MYVAIEGVDTCGKSTQIALLKRRFPEAIYTKEPGGTALGMKLRELLLGGEAKSAKAELLLFLADRWDELWLKSLNLFATEGIVPDKVVILELTAKELSYRLSQKSHDSIESRGVEYLLELQERIKQMTALLGIPSLTLSASLSPEEIHGRIVSGLALKG
jgi:dTMP kinase